ncbi:YuzF family protein [Paenibacillus sp. MBLB4367]|uniref:YuzF family protein n=1 Tax=Paenibacillus sp. MBLB4367 TaxID=3384767 RepID=UPI00390817F0
MYNPSMSAAGSFEPYLYQTLQSAVGGGIVVQTAAGSVRGLLKSAAPDHIVVEVSGVPFFIRTAQIVWVTPC